MNTKNRCIFVWLILSGLIGCHKNHPSSPPDKPPPLLLISFDGFRHDYLSKTDTPYFDEFTEQGVRSKGLIPVFPSLTFPNHYAIATGLWPQDNGLVDNTMYDPKFGAWYRIYDRKAVQNPRWYRGEPIWNTVEKQGLKAGTLFWVGSEAPIEHMRPTHWKPYDESMPYKAHIDTVVKWLAAPDAQAVDFATLYFDQPDHYGHLYGPQSDSVKAQIKRADRMVGYLKQRMQAGGLWDSTNIIILSDHGMIQLSADKTINLDHIIDSTHLKQRILGPLTMLQPKEGMEETMYQQLKNQAGHYRIYKKEHLPASYHIKHSRRVFDLVMVADLGYTIITDAYKSRFLKSLPAGTHGYDPRNDAMHALFMVRGPAFKRGATVRAFRNIHLYDLMAHVLYVQPAPNDGSLDSMLPLLKKPR